MLDINIPTLTILVDNAASTCTSIPANPDFSGIGVRVAFYLQSFMNALLVVLSPKESVSVAWAGTLLTVSLVIAGIVGKYIQPASLTLHHATLILNFTTLSCISSLATAPKLPIWRMTHEEYFRLQRQRFAVTGASTLPLTREDIMLEDDVYVNLHKKRIKQEQRKGRLFIAFALLLQVVAQWAWCMMLFVSWGNYECPELSGDTRLVLFGYGFYTKNINSFDDPNVRWNFVLWPLWLILCLACTLALTIILALTGPDAAQDVSDSRSPSTMPSESANTPVLQVLARAARNGIVTWATKGHQRALFIDSLSFIMWACLIVSSEVQRSINHVDSSENNPSGFGQITALLLAMAPVWSLWTSFISFVEHLHREQNRERLEDHHLLPGPAESEDHGPEIAPPIGHSATRVARESYEMGPLTRRPSVARASSPAPHNTHMYMNSEDESLPLIRADTHPGLHIHIPSGSL